MRLCSQLLFVVVLLSALACASNSNESQGVQQTATKKSGPTTVASFGIDIAEESVLPGKQSTDPTDEHDDPTGGITEMDSLGNFAIAALWGQNGYYRTGKYNDNYWKVELGTLTGGPEKLPAFTLHPPTHLATKHVVSKHGLFWRFAKAVDHRIYELVEGAPVVVAEVSADVITPGQHAQLGALHGNEMTAPRTFIIAPQTVVLSAFSQLGEGAEGAILEAGPLGKRTRYRFSVDDVPWDTASAFKAGPAAHANRYGQNRHFFAIFNGEQAGVVWQSPVSGQIYATWFGADLMSRETAALERPAGTVLAAATSDGQGTLYYLLVQEGTKAEEGTRQVTLIRATAAEGTLASEKVDAAKKGLNITVFGTAKGGSNQAALRWSKGELGLILARKMHKAGDGLNHQGAIGVVFDAETLKVKKNLGQTSGHSFESFLTVGSDGRFLALDLGDNFPRGVNLHRFDGQGRKSRVVYTFKTAHGKKAKNPAGKTFAKYEDLPGGGSIYKWSNDNSTYTEIGGVVETAKGLLVVFASERSSLNNAKAIGLHNAPRNLAAVVVRKDFENASKSKGSGEVTEDLILSQSDYTMAGGYYSFTGKWTPQRNVGVLWQTSYADKGDNASRIKVAPLPGDRAAVLWERWSAKAYEQTLAMVLDADGGMVVAPAAIEDGLRLGRRDDPFLHNGRLFVISGEGAGRSLVLDVFDHSGRADPAG